MPSVNEALVYSKQNGLRPQWAIFPVRGKYPAIPASKGGHGCKDASSDPDIIRKWWSEYPSANIGIATGEKNGIVVLDIDRNHGADIDGNDTLHELEEKLGALPDTVEVLTPNGGRHLYFKYPSGYNIGIHKSEKEDKWPGIDIRGNGGYVVAPPSSISCTDRKVRAYEWEASSYPNETPLAELPTPWVKWLDDLCGRHGGFTLPAPEDVRPGKRNDTLFSYACQLRNNGHDHDGILEKLTEYNSQMRTPLTPRELQTIAGSAMKYTPKVTSSEDGNKRPRMSRAILADTLQALGYGVKYNLITCSYEVIGRTETGRAMNLDDLCTTLHDVLSESYKGTSPDIISMYLTFEARENSYNPVLELLSATTWDGQSRMAQVYELLGIESDALSRSLVKKWLFQTIALLFNDQDHPYGADGCLVLNGVQGAGKTSFFRHLALKDEWFGEGCSIDDHDKDTSRRVLTKWISELGEVESTLKSDISKLKAFVTASVDAYRLPYAKSDTVAPRHTSLCATCNSDRYLIDQTGNRRWWSIPFTKIIPHDELLKLDALQLWAEVFTAVKDMSSKEKASCYRLTQAEHEALAARNGQFEKPVKGQEEVEDILATATAKGYAFKDMTIAQFKEWWPVLRSYSVQQIGAALSRCGIETSRTNKTRTRTLPTQQKL